MPSRVQTNLIAANMIYDRSQKLVESRLGVEQSETGVCNFYSNILILSKADGCPHKLQITCFESALFVCLNQKLRRNSREFGQNSYEASNQNLSFLIVIEDSFHHLDDYLVHSYCHRIPISRQKLQNLQQRLEKQCKLT